MPNPPPNNITPSNDDLSIPTYVTMPDGNKYHWIEDSKLEGMMKTPAPVSLIMSLTCLGYALGDLRNVIALKDKYSGTITITYNLNDVIFFGVFCAALAVGVTTGIYWIASKIGTTNILREIRSRKPKPWPSDGWSGQARP